MFTENPLLFQVALEIAARAILQNEIDIFLVDEIIQQLDDVLMLHLMMNGDLGVQPIEHRRRARARQEMPVRRVRFLLEFLPVDLRTRIEHRDKSPVRVKQCVELRSCKPREVHRFFGTLRRPWRIRPCPADGRFRSAKREREKEMVDDERRLSHAYIDRVL